MNHDLDQDLQESFEFKLGGHTYKMRYPTTDEVFEITKEKDETAQMDKMYSFIEGVGENVPHIKKVLGKSNIKVMQRFNQMVKTEFIGEL